MRAIVDRSGSINDSGIGPEKEGGAHRLIEENISLPDSKTSPETSIGECDVSASLPVPKINTENNIHSKCDETSSSADFRLISEENASPSMTSDYYENSMTLWTKNFHRELIYERVIIIL